MDSNITGNKLTHMTHIEDMLLLGPSGISIVQKTLNDVFHALEGNSSESSRISLKVDGAPSCICASDFNGLTFVATKGFFSKERRYATTEEECDTLYGHAPELAEKMKALLRYLPSISIPHNEIWQGDFLFSKKDLNYNNGNITFKPNTIVYSIPEDDPIGHLISEAEIGVAWHTRYTGPDFDNLKISFDANVDNVNTVSQVFQMDPRLPSIIGTGTLTLDETLKVSDILDQLSYDFRDLITSPIFPIESDLQLIINTYRNSQIRSGSEEVLFDKVREAVINKYDLDASKMKTEKGRATKEARKQALLTILDQNKDNYIKLFELQGKVATLKNFFVKKLNTLGSFKTLVQHIDKGYLPCGQEGFAVSDAYGNVVKLVSRLEFSANNFSKEIVKGWTSEKREAEGNSFTESFVGEDLLYKWAIVDSPDDIDENLYKSLIKEKTENFQKTDINVISDFLNTFDYLKPRFVRGATDKEIDVNVEVEPTEESNMKRGEAALLFKQYLDEANISYSYDILNGNDKYQFSIEFPREDGLSNILAKITFKLSSADKRGAQNTARKELIYATSLDRYFRTGKNFITDEEKTSSGLDKAWEKSILQTNEKVYDFILNGGNKRENPEDYYVSREGFSTDPNLPSIHNFISSAYKIFGYAKKDTWNPSDLYIMKKDYYSIFYNNYNKLLKEQATLEEFNKYLLEEFNAKNVIGISLKKSLGNVELKVTGYMSPTALNVENVSILTNPRMPYPIFPSDLKTRELTAGCAIDKIQLGSDFYKVDFRTYGGTSVQLTPTPLNHKGAQSGKFSSVDMYNLMASYGVPTDLAISNTSHYRDPQYLQYELYLISDKSKGLSLIDEIDNFNKDQTSFKITFGKGDTLFNGETVYNWINSINWSTFNTWSSVDKKFIYVFTFIIGYLVMLIRSYYKGEEDFKDIWNLLIKSASKETMLNAPYLKAY